MALSYCKEAFPLLPDRDNYIFWLLLPISVRTADRLTKTLYSQHGWCLWLFRLGPGCGFDSLPINLPKCLWKISKYLKGSMSNLEQVPTWLNEIEWFQGRRDRSRYHSLMVCIADGAVTLQRHHEEQPGTKVCMLFGVLYTIFFCC